MGLFEMAKIVTGWAIRKPATLMYPAKPAKVTPLTRGHVVIDVSKCISCRICQKKCPSQAICVEPKEKTWQIDRLRCNVCNSCVDNCPVKCLSMDIHYISPSAERPGPELFQITYVKPPKPEKADSTESTS